MEKQQPPAYVQPASSPSPVPGQPVQPGYAPQMQPQQQYGAPQQYAQPGMQQYGMPGQQPIQQPQMAYGQPQMMQPVMTQPTGPPAGQIYQSAVPIQTLGESSAPIDCPSCHQRSMTNTTRVAGDCTHLWAIGACLVLCLPCIPYLIDSFKDVEHKCGKCGVHVATCKKSGGTTVHVFS